MCIPLNFLFKVLFRIYYGLFSGDQGVFRHLFTEVIRLEDTRTLMIIYGIGAGLIFFILSLMYRYALKKKEELELDEYEMFVTRHYLGANMLMGAIPVLSALIAMLNLFGNATFTIAGFTYFLYPPVMILYSLKKNKARNKLLQKLKLSL